MQLYETGSELAVPYFLSCSRKGDDPDRYNTLGKSANLLIRKKNSKTTLYIYFFIYSRINGLKDLEWIR